MLHIFPSQELPQFIRATRPFRCFLFSVVVSACCICWAVAKHRGLSWPDGELKTRDTFSIGLLASFIPFVFAAITYARSKLAALVPETIVETSLTREIRAAWAYITVLFLCSLLAPFMDMTPPDKALVQLVMVLSGFLVSVCFIYDLIRLSDYRVLVPFYGDSVANRISRSLQRITRRLHQDGGHRLGGLQGDGPLVFEIPDELAEKTKAIAEDFLALINRATQENRLREMSIAFEELARVSQAYYEGSSAFWIQQDKYTMYLVSELRKVVDLCADPVHEKFLDSICTPLERTILSVCCFEVNMHTTNYLVLPWERFLADTALQTAEPERVANSNYPMWAIAAMGRLGTSAIEAGHVGSVSSGLVGRLSKLACRLSEADDWWADMLAVQANLSLCKLLSHYSKSWLRYQWPDDFFLHEWGEKMQNALQSVLNNYRPGLGAQDPLAPFLEAGWFGTNLPREYAASMEALGSVYPADFAKQLGQPPEGVDSVKSATVLLRMKRKELLCVHGIVRVLLNKELATESCWNNVGLTLSSLFWIDLVACCGQLGVSDGWLDSAVNAHRHSFARMQDIYGEDNEALDDHAAGFISNTLAIPALALVYRREENAEFVDSVMTDYCEAYISVFEKVAQRQSKRIQMWWGYGLLLAAWLNGASRFPELKGRLESLLKEHRPAVRDIPHASKHQRLGYPTEMNRVGGSWYLSPTPHWTPETQKTVSAQLMDEECLIEYAESLAEGHGNTQPG